ncbi:MAG TPA: hypothetical protein VNG53_01250 [Bacteroidia bacterium]|nr:hypothetical protein [Bacteroidia bacterium]
MAVQWLNEALCFVSSSVVADSLRLRNRQPLVAAKRYAQCYDDSATNKFYGLTTDFCVKLTNSTGQILPLKTLT